LETATYSFVTKLQSLHIIIVYIQSIPQDFKSLYDILCSSENGLKYVQYERALSFVTIHNTYIYIYVYVYSSWSLYSHKFISRVV